MQVVSDLIKNVVLPKMIKVEQQYDHTHISPATIEQVVKKQLERTEIAGKIQSGMNVAITCGSRGIKNYAAITKTIVDVVKARGGNPFIVAAMGSHGGATSNGQRQIIADYGITEETMKCPIKSDMDTVKIGYCKEFNTEVRIDKNAASADAIIVFNRIKVHTSFHGAYESGLMKMMAIGLGKQHGANIIHAVDPEQMDRVVELHGKICLENTPVIGGLAVIENAFDDTWKIVGMTPEEIVKEEPCLLLEAKQQFATILFDSCDVLIVDKIGKNISGDGMDPNVIGRYATNIRGGIQAGKIVVLDLTEETHGNAQGIGNADVTTKRLENKMRREMTYPTAVTNKFLGLDKLPMVMDNDKEAIQLALRACYCENTEKLRIIRIQDTAHLEKIEISEAMCEEARNNPRTKIMSEPFEWEFDDEGNLW